MNVPIYMDYAAATPADPRVAEAMMDCLTLDGNFGNPASRSHKYGWVAERAVEKARKQLAQLIGADPRELVWTSGATESNNLAIKGVAEKAGSGKHIVTNAIEHKAVLDPCRYLEKSGFKVTYLTPDSTGRISADQVADALQTETVLVSIMAVNNELGTTNPIEDIARVCRERGVLFHVDGAQAVGKIPVDVTAWGVDLLSLSGHKMYGPKGIGALYVRRDPKVSIDEQIHGGGHERGMRSGTLPTHQIVGIGVAANIAKDDLEKEHQHLQGLRERFLKALGHLSGWRLNGHETHSVPGIMNIGFSGVEGETLLVALSDIAVSTGSACTSASMEPSYVLKGIGLPDELAFASVRFSLGRFITPEEVDHAAEHVINTVKKLRGETP